MNETAPDPLVLRDTIAAMLRTAASARQPNDPTAGLLDVLMSLAPWRERADVMSIGVALHAELRGKSTPPPALRLVAALAAEGLRRADRVRDLLHPLVPTFGRPADPDADLAAGDDDAIAAAIARRADLQLGFFASSATLATLEVNLSLPAPADLRLLPVLGIEIFLSRAIAAAIHGYGERSKALFETITTSELPPSDRAQHARYRAFLGLASHAWRMADLDACAHHALTAADQARAAAATWEQRLATWFASAACVASGVAPPPLELDAFAFAAAPDLGTDLFAGLPVEPLAGPLRAGAVPMASALAAAITERTIAVDPAGLALVAALALALHRAGAQGSHCQSLVEAAIDALVGMPGGVGSPWYVLLKRMVHAAPPTVSFDTPSPPRLPWLPRVTPEVVATSATGLGPTGTSRLPDIRDLALDPAILSGLLGIDATPSGTPTTPAAPGLTPTDTIAAPHIDEAFIAPDYLWRYRCNGQGCCCGGWRAGLTESDIVRLETLTAGTTLAPVVRVEVDSIVRGPFAAWLPPRSGRPAGYTTHVGQLRFAAPGDRCSFLLDDRLCSIHQELGEHALPDVCQIFPIVSRASELGTTAAWDLVCPEVARRLAESDTPARLVPRPADVGRSFSADPDRPPEAPRTVDMRVSLDRLQYHLFRRALASAFGECSDRPLAVLAAAVDVLVEWEADGHAPDFALAARARVGPSFLPHILEAIAQRIAYPWDPMAEVADHVALCRNFFRHHPWGTELTLDALAAAFDPITGRTGWPVRALAWLRSATPPIDVVLANHLMALFAEPEPTHGNLMREVASALGRVGDIVLTRGVMGESSDPAVARGVFTAAIVFADLPHRRSDDGYAAFSQGFRETLARPLDPCPALTGALADLAHPLADHLED
jgi:hypothetical protein